MAFDIEALENLTTRLSSCEGVPTTQLRDLLRCAFGDERSAKDLNDFRRDERPWKKLRDEVAPISAFLDTRNLTGQIRFALDSTFPDAWFAPEGGQEVGIEVTRALGRADKERATELVSEGIGSTYVGLPDGRPKTEFDHTMQRKRMFCTSEQKIRDVQNGITHCLNRKNNAKYAGMWLLVLAPLRGPQRSAWANVAAALAELAASMPFAQVHVVDETGVRPFGFQIK